jgi:hypothetical protein
MTEVSEGRTEETRLIASVVFLVNTTDISAGAPRNCERLRRADSNTEVVTWERNPAPRCTLLYQGRSSPTVAQTDSRQGALAAVSKLT